MSDFRIKSHPILKAPDRESVPFFWQGQELQGLAGEMLTAALFANGIRTFGHHHRDGSPQGLFCANGQCSQCMVLVDGRPVKACMTPLHAGMRVDPVDSLPELPVCDTTEKFADPRVIQVPVLILGGGPAGLSAAIQLGKRGIKCLLVDDKDRLGGKLVLQTHRFFGSINAVHAGTRGIDIATRLEEEVRTQESVEVWLNTTALAVFSDKRVGLLRQTLTDGVPREEYVLVESQLLLVSTGAREKTLLFPGNTLPGVYGAGAFQTLVNRDLVRSCKRLFIVGGGNVGLIAGYHALQAGIEVAGLIEALPECGGYKVHKDKLVRMGVPVYTRHTILGVEGEGQVERVTIAAIDENWQPIPGTSRTFECDAVLIAVGLDPVDEFLHKAREYDMQVLAAGDAEEIAEASAAIFAGKIRGLEIARQLGVTDDAVPEEWARTAEILKSRPGECGCEAVPEVETGVFPVIHCSQEIPCNPCTSVCPRGQIVIDEQDIREVPAFLNGEIEQHCIGCEKCVTICPGLAITLVDYRKDQEHPLVTLAFEFQAGTLAVGDRVTVLDTIGDRLGEAEVVRMRDIPRNGRTVLLQLRVDRTIAKRVAGVLVQEEWVADSLPEAVERLEDEVIVCRCERVTAGEIRALIREGVRDLNAIKAITRAGMGACGGKTCQSQILRLFREEGVPMEDVTPGVPRPLFVEVPLGTFARGSRQ